MVPCFEIQFASFDMSDDCGYCAPCSDIVLVFELLSDALLSLLQDLLHSFVAQCFIVLMSLQNWRFIDNVCC